MINLKLKSIQCLCVSFIALFAILVTASSLVAKTDKNTFNFKYPSWESPGSWLNENMYFWWPRRVQELTKGQVTFNEFPGGTLSEGFDHYPNVRDGVIAFAPTAGAYTIDTLPLLSVLDLPEWWQDHEYSIYLEGLNHLLNNGLQEYFHDKGIHAFAICPLDRYTFWTTKKSGPVREPKDAKGMKIRSPGGIASETLVSVGANPVTLSTGDVYTALQRGIIDGITLTSTSVVSLGLVPALDYWTPQALGTKATILIIGNYETYKNLPPSIQNAMDKAGEEMQEQWWTWMTEFLKNEAKEAADNNNVKIIELDTESKEKFEEKQEKVWEDWKSKYGSVYGGKGNEFINVLKKYKNR
ncbi:MAG: TRAP transporter substrate-binding protein DctP [Desulfovermiculus sp.]|nr:TRAP transporter substrate-binding protein DctP [Desulfovermiculus sp.]